MYMCNTNIHTHMYPYVPFVWHHGAKQEKRDQRDKEDLREHLQLYHGTVTYWCHALWWWSSQSFSFTDTEQLKTNCHSSKLRPRTPGALCIPSSRLFQRLLARNSISWITQASNSNQNGALLPVNKEIKLCSAAHKVLLWFGEMSLFIKALRNMLKITLCLYATLNNEGLKHILKSFLMLGTWKYTVEPKRKGICLSSCQVF